MGQTTRSSEFYQRSTISVMSVVSILRIFFPLCLMIDYRAFLKGRDKGPTSFLGLIVQNLFVEVSLIALVDSIAESAENFHLGMGDVIIHVQWVFKDSMGGSGQCRLQNRSSNQRSTLIQISKPWADGQTVCHFSIIGSDLDSHSWCTVGLCGVTHTVCCHIWTVR